MTHDLMRGLKDEPFMLMEQTPSQQNWQHYNSLKRPGQMRAQSYQTIAHGADTIQFFQLRRSKGGLREIPWCCNSTCRNKRHKGIQGDCTAWKRA